MTAAGEGRDLVALQTHAGGSLGDRIKHVAGQVVVGQVGRRRRRKAGVGLNRQVVDRQVRRLERQRDVQVGVQLRQALARQCVHQVEVEGVESRSGLGQRGARLRTIVNPTQLGQHRIVETLHAHRQPGHTGFAEITKAIALKTARVGLERDLATRQQGQPGADRRQQPADRVGREQAGCAATDEHAVHRPTPDLGQRGFQVGDQCLDIA